MSLISGIEGCPFAIKGNTHSPAAGFANIQDGITVDMTGLKSVTLNSDRTVASIGGGASWLDVYAYLDAFNVSVAGGRNGLVGIGGLTLGGGISHFAARVGWACDNVVNFEVRKLLFQKSANRLTGTARRCLRFSHQRERKQ